MAMEIMLLVSHFDVSKSHSISSYVSSAFILPVPFLLLLFVVVVVVHFNITISADCCVGGVYCAL